MSQPSKQSEGRRKRNSNQPVRSSPAPSPRIGDETIPPISQIGQTEAINQSLTSPTDPTLLSQQQRDKTTTGEPEPSHHAKSEPTQPENVPIGHVTFAEPPISGRSDIEIQDTLDDALPTERGRGYLHQDSGDPNLDTLPTTSGRGAEIKATADTLPTDGGRGNLKHDPSATLPTPGSGSIHDPSATSPTPGSGSIQVPDNVTFPTHAGRDTKTNQDQTVTQVISKDSPLPSSGDVDDALNAATKSQQKKASSQVP